MNNESKAEIKTPDAAVRTGKTRTLALIGVMTAVICILGPLSLPLPFSPVPISLGTLAVFFSVYVLGMSKGTVSYLIYLLLGFAGVPVFTAFTAGPAKLLGPTGGYLIGMIFMALIAGFFIDRFPGKIYLHLIGMIIGMAVNDLFGTIWLAHQADMTFPQALAAGVLPFLAGDLAKIVIALIAGLQVRKALARAGFSY